MPTTKNILPAVALAWLAVPHAAGAAGEVTISLQRYRSASTSFERYEDCRDLTVSAFVGWQEAWSRGTPTTTRRTTSLQVAFSDSCTPGSAVQTQVSISLPTSPAIGPRLDGTSLMLEQDAPAYVCNELTEGGFDCQDTTIPVTLELRWEERGRLLQDVSVARTPQEDGSIQIVTTRNLGRAAKVFVSGTVGDQVIDFSQDSQLLGGERLEVQVPRR